MSQPKILIDVTALVTASFTKKKLTGILRVAFAYVKQFHPKAQAVISLRSYLIILSEKNSQQIFSKLLNGESFLKLGTLLHIIKAGLISPLIPPNTVLLKLDYRWLNYDSYYQKLKKLHILPIIMIHDLIPIQYPEYFGRNGKKTHHGILIKGLSNAKGILTNSQDTYNGIMTYCKQNKLSLPPLTTALLGALQINQDLKFIHRPLEANYFVILGTIEGRKNHLLLLQIWRILVDKHGINTPKLIIIGQRGWNNQNTLNMLSQCDKIRDYVTELAATDLELITYLKYAQALLFPTFSEGFGFPLVEALSVGAPVIASDLAVFKEIAGNVPDYIHPIDGAKWLAVIEEYNQENSQLRKAQLQRMQNLQLPTWKQHFDIVENFITDLFDYKATC